MAETKKRFVETKEGGYWVKEKNRGSLTKSPFFCPHEDCRRITSTIDDSYMEQYGVCAKCYVNLVEDRQKPLIDVEFYRDRLKERGY